MPENIIRAWPIPEVIAPLKRRCVVLYIPDQRDHIAAFWGALLPLTQWLHWERDDEKSGKELAAVWKGVVYPAWDNFGKDICCPEPEPEPETEPEPTKGNGSGAVVGMMGLGIEELENLLMGSIMDIRISNGLLQVQYFPCCDWVTIGNIASIAAAGNPTPPTVGGESGSPDWEGFGVPISPPTQAGLHNSRTMQCVKATAIKYELRTFMQNLVNYIDETNDTIEVVIAGLTIFLAQIGLPELIPLGMLADILSDFGVDTIIEEFQEFLDDTELWEDFVCQLAEDLSGADEVTGKDISAFYLYMTSETIDLAESVLMLVSRLSLVDFQAKVAYSVAHVGCECSSFLPYGFEPSLGSGEFRFTLDRLFKAYNASGNAVNPTAGENFAGIDTPSGEDGTIINGYPATELLGQDSGYWWHGFGAILELSEEADLTEIRITITLPNGEPTPPQQIAFAAYTFNVTSQQWEGWGGQTDTSSPYQTEYVISAAVNDVSHVAIQLLIQSSDSGTARTARSVSIRMTGTYPGDTFVQLELGEVHVP